MCWAHALCKLDVFGTDRAMLDVYLGYVRHMPKACYKDAGIMQCRYTGESSHLIGIAGHMVNACSTVFCFFFFFPEALRRVLLPKAAANFTCQLLMPTCRELLHLPTSHVNFLESYFTCQLLMPTF